MLLIPCPWCGAAQPARVHVRRRCHAAAAGARCARGRVGRLRVSARQPARPARRALAARRRVPAVAGRAPRHAHARHRGQCTGTRRPPRAAGSGIAVTQPFRLAQGGRIDRAQPLRFRFDGGALRGLRRRHARLGAARQRRAPRRPQLQVSPAARHRHRAAATSRTRWCSSATARAASRTCARRWSSSATACVAASQNRWPSLRHDAGALAGALSPAAARGLLLQDVHVARLAARVALLRALDPARRGPRDAPRSTRTPIATCIVMRIATCSWSVRAAPGSRRRALRLRAARA